jgi:hypothetical protein
VSTLRSPSRAAPLVHVPHHDGAEQALPTALLRARATALLHRELARAPIAVAMQRFVDGMVPDPLLGTMVQVETSDGVVLLRLERVSPGLVALDRWMARAASVARTGDGTLALDTVFADAPARIFAAHVVHEHGLALSLVLAESRATRAPLLSLEVVAQLSDTMAGRLREVWPAGRMR